MNYPVWDISMGTGMLMALVAIIHVFVSHFAVGSGLFLLVSEKKAYKDNDTHLLEWLKMHSRFFILISVVYGAVSGVGIWFTIGLISPSATSMLIHTFVWAWATEWVFFFLEITSALLYYYGWDKLTRQTHLWLGWIYFISAFMSMVIINGIVAFMLTAGDWPDTQNFWDGFLNPTYGPSLAIRFVFSLALAGIYAFVTASRIDDPDVKAKIIKWANMWIIPAFILLPFIAMWYIGNVPTAQWESALGAMPTATFYADLIMYAAIVTFVLAVLAWFMARRVSFVYSMVLLLSALATMWSFEYIREAIRKPYVIGRFMYANGLLESPSDTDGGFSVEKIDEKGILNTARWIKYDHITEENKVDVGREIFRVECQSCHTVDHYRGIKNIIGAKKWDRGTIYKMLDGLDLMRNAVMPPFSGKDEEREALADWLAQVTSAPSQKQEVSGDGAQVYNTYCNSCHNYKPHDALFRRLKSWNKEKTMARLDSLPALFNRMPDLELSEKERSTLIDWAKEQFNGEKGK
ncbi:MAG: hypothetical protein D6677_05090 [Calditrichaeota bacterium]|nr:MAG: hypothetical protein D6677_05090 [Calditrichota bacterium]